MFCLNSEMLNDIRAEILQYGVPEDLLNAREEEVRCAAQTEVPPEIAQARKECSKWRLKSLREEQRAVKAEMLLAVVKTDKEAAKVPKRSVAHTCAPREGSERRIALLLQENSEWRVKYLQEKQRADKAEQLLRVKEEKIEQLKKTVGKLSAHIKWIRQQIFGSTSERRTEKEQAPAKPALEEQDTDNPNKGRGKQRGQSGAGRKRDQVEPTPVNHDLEEKDKVCKCGCELVLADLAPLVSYETHLVEEVVVREHIRRKVIGQCNGCGRRYVRKAPVPPKLVPKGKYSPEFWRTIIEEKFWLQRPLNRLIKKLKSLGAKVRPGTIANGLKRLHKMRIFEVIYEAILDRSRLAEVRNMDETGWKVFADEEKTGWYLWTSITNDTTVFIVDPSRSSTVVAEYLEGVTSGIIVSDRHSAYKKFVRLNETFLIAFCWVHQRRDMIKLQTAFPQYKAWAQDWQDKIDALIAQNKVRVKALGTTAFKAQDDILRTMVEQFRAELVSQLKNKKSLAKEQLDELKSLDAHWQGLTVFVDNPHVPMDNNEAERALREAVLGRKNYYGSRSLWSAYQTSWLFSIYATLEQHGIDPHEWMGEYLNACARNNGLPPADKELAKFLPWNYKGRNEKTEPIKPDGAVEPVTESTAEQAIHSIIFSPELGLGTDVSPSGPTDHLNSQNSETPESLLSSQTYCTSTTKRSVPTSNKTTRQRNAAESPKQSSASKTSHWKLAHSGSAQKPP